ncbi:MAG: CheR family methyltransferase [Planctomycetota bacterium]
MSNAGWSEAGYAGVASVVASRTGLVFGPTRFESAEQGIRRSMARAGITDFPRYRHLLESDSHAWDDLLAELVIGETYFFRDVTQFEFIRREVLPDLQRRCGAGHVVRAWSAACASGEEAYSLAMLFAEEGLAGRSHILGTDISRRALAAARRGSYRNWSFRGDGAARAKRFVTRRGEESTVADVLRDRVAFEHLNLALDIWPSTVTGTAAMDLILCRNVLIYFDPATVASVARRLFESLAPGGWLVTGASDPPLGEHAPFETVLAPEGVFLRRGPAHVHRGSPPTIEPPADLEACLEALQGLPIGCQGLSETKAPLSGPPDGQIESPNFQTPNVSPLCEAREALSRAEYERAIQLTSDLTEDAEMCAIHVQALANADATRAEQVCAAATARHPLSAELHYLHAILLLGLEQNDAAVSAIRRVLYLDRSLALAHFTLGTILHELGDVDGAQRAYRNTRDLCGNRPPDELVPLANGERVERLKETVDRLLVQLSDIQNSSPPV